MTKTSAVVALSVLGLSGAYAAGFSANAVKSGDYVHVPAGEVVAGGLFFAGAVLVVDGDIDGDLMAFGAYVEVNGNVAGDLFASAAAVTVNGNVAGDARCYGAVVTFNGDIGGAATFGSAGFFCRGNIAGDVAGGAAAALLGGSFGRDVTVKAGYLSLEDGARIARNLTYRADRWERSPAAAVGGDIKLLPGDEEEKGRGKGFNFTWWLIKNIWRILSLFVLAAFTYWLWPAILTAVPGHIRSRPAACVLWGIAVLVGAPVAALFLAVSLVGLPSAAALAAAYLITLYAARIFAGVYVGRLVLTRLAAGREPPVLFTALIGIIILVLAGNIPYVKVLLAVAIWVFTFGAAALYLWRARHAGA